MLKNLFIIKREIKMGILSEIRWSEVSTGGEVLPEGVYNLRVLKAEEKETKSGGAYISLFMKVVDGELEGKTCNTNLNVNCPSSKKAEDIAKAQVKILFTNNGLEKIDSVADLVGLESPAKVTIQKNEQFGDGNNVNFRKAKKSEEELPF
jgi:hypothetical protein